VGPRELRAGARSRLYSAREEWTQARSASDGASRPSRAPGLCWLRDSEERGKMDAYRTRDRRRGANVIAINEQVSVPDEELSWSFVRSGGPGGQNVNKVASKAVLRWRLADNRTLPEEARARLVGQQRRRITTEGELIITSQAHRDQDRN